MKIILRILKWIFISIAGLLLIVFLFLLFDNGSKTIVLSDADKQSIVIQKEYTQEVASNQYELLLKKYGKNKTLAKGFELQCLLALSHYPELKETPIDFLVEPAFLPLASQPETMSILFPWKERKYLVIISNASTDYFEKILLRNTPFNEQVGILGHELAHVIYYQDKSSLDFIGIAYNYQYNNDYRNNFERNTDKRAVAHGLGYQMVDFAYFVRRAFGQSEEDIEKEEGDMYLSPNELLKEMKKYDYKAYQPLNQ